MLALRRLRVPVWRLPFWKIIGPPAKAGSPGEIASRPASEAGALAEGRGDSPAIPKTHRRPIGFEGERARRHGLGIFLVSIAGRPEPVQQPLGQVLYDLTTGTMGGTVQGRLNRVTLDAVPLFGRLARHHRGRCQEQRMLSPK